MKSPASFNCLLEKEIIHKIQKRMAEQLSDIDAISQKSQIEIRCTDPPIIRAPEAAQGEPAKAQQPL